MFDKKVGCLVILTLGLVVVPLMAQFKDGTVSGQGRGEADSQALALEAAKLDAVNELVLGVLKRDTVFRDLLVPEAFKYDWFFDVWTEVNEAGHWQATVNLKVDEGVIEALYLGRYSTTLGALLDQAELAIAKIESFLSEAALKESNGDLSAAETAFRQAEAKTAEALRYIGPVNDAFYFSSIGNRKAPELQALLKSYAMTAVSGIGRIREGREKLNLDQEYQNALQFLDSVESELARIEAGLSQFQTTAASVSSYDSDMLRNQSEIGRIQKESLLRHRQLVLQERKKLNPTMEYPILRSGFVLDKVDGLTRIIDTGRSAISTELFKRSAFAKALVWLVQHEPHEYLSVGLFLPIGLSAGAGEVQAASPPLCFEIRAEGAARIGNGGVWGRTRFFAGQEELLTASAITSVHQLVEVGFYSSVLIGAGFRWDWQRSVADGPSLPPILAASIIFGAAGSDLGRSRLLPVWTLGITWELPRGDGFVLARDLNLSLESIIRPSTWVKIDTELASKARETINNELVWNGSLAQGIGFRLPFIKPLLWKFRWEGDLFSVVEDGQFSSEGQGRHLFRFGLEYAF